MQPSCAILIAASLATLGWLYTARRARRLARKQHTISVMLQASFHNEFRAALALIAPHLRKGECPEDLVEAADNDDLRTAFRFVLNHYEFIAAGLRNGDFDESLVRDSERGTILSLINSCEKLVWKLRDTRKREALYEHIIWLRRRWETKPPGFWQRLLECCIGRPLPSRRHNPHED